MPGLVDIITAHLTVLRCPSDMLQLDKTQYSFGPIAISRSPNPVAGVRHLCKDT